MTSSKSPNKVAFVAYCVAKKSLPAYSHQFSPKKYSQHQLVALLVLKEFFNTDYRGLVVMVSDSINLCRILELKEVPHYTTIQKAGSRILNKKIVRKIIKTTVSIAQKNKIIKSEIKLSAIDSTGMEAGHTSRYFVKRKQRDPKIGYQITTYKRFPKLALSCDTKSHIINGALTGKGPSPDNVHFKKMLEESQSILKTKMVVADAGYDSEENHRFAREDMGVKSIINPKIGRPTNKLPSGTYRREMVTDFPKKLYGQRWQIETVISMIKRNFDEELKAKTFWSQCREMLMKVVAHNVVILLPI